jgi:antitoxin VapB
MALSIKTDEADALARALAAATNESLTQAVTVALRERLERVRDAQQPTLHAKLTDLAADYAAAQVVIRGHPTRSPGMTPRALLRDR